MKRSVIAFGCVGMMVACGVMLAVPTQADEFDVLWAIDLPREVYFIGESVVFGVKAFTSDVEGIFLPGEMALVTIRNGSSTEMFSGWITTNINGTNSISWDIPLESHPDNYTITLDPIVGPAIGGAITASFITAFDQDTYWQKRVEFLEDELTTQYEYLNYLFGSNKYLLNQVSVLKDQVAIAGAVMTITILATLWVVIPEWARRSSEPTKKSLSGRLAGLLGLSNTPKVLLTEQHEELAQIKTKEGRRPPRCGLDYVCKLCDPDKKLPMTKNQYDEHLNMHYKRNWSIRAWRRNQLYKDLIDEHYQLPEVRPPHEKILEADRRKDELVESVELSRKELKAIAAEKAKYEDDTKLERERLSTLKKEAKRAAKPPKKDKPEKPPKKYKPEKPPKEKRGKRKKDKDEVPTRKRLLKRNRPPKPEPQRKVRRIKQHSGIPKDEPVKPVRTILRTQSRTQVDELLDKLLKEKVK